MPAVVVLIFILLASLIKEPARQKIMALPIFGAGVVLSHLYVTSSGLSAFVLALPPARSAATHTVVPVEALPSLDSVFGLDVIAVPAGP
jgi:hypothetical protein